MTLFAISIQQFYLDFRPDNCKLGRAKFYKPSHWGGFLLWWRWPAPGSVIPKSKWRIFRDYLTV